MWLKVAYSAFMVVLVPVYAVKYGPANFLYFCDIALLLTLVGLWRDDRLLISIPAVGILALQSIWLLDFAAHFAGTKVTGVTDYMFETQRSLFLRGLSLFHGWLPLLLAWLVCRTGYDRRALAAWTGLTWLLLPVCYFMLPPPSASHGVAAVNVNYVFGFSDEVAQTWMPPLVWLSAMMVVLPALLFVPTHYALIWATRSGRGEQR
jgi:hypothetical protein